MRALVSLAVGLALAASGAASAHDEGEHGAKSHSHWWLGLKSAWYAGGSLGQSTFSDVETLAEALDDGSYTSRSQDDSDTSFRLFAGMDFLDHFALEFGYADFGEASFRAQSDGSGTTWAAGPVTESVSVEGFDLALLGKLPLFEHAALFGRVGVLSWESNIRMAGADQTFGPFVFKAEDDSTNLIYGAGLEYDRFQPLRIVAAYSATTFKHPFFQPDSKLGAFTVSVAYLF